MGRTCVCHQNCKSTFLASPIITCRPGCGRAGPLLFRVCCNCMCVAPRTRYRICLISHAHGLPDPVDASPAAWVGRSFTHLPTLRLCRAGACEGGRSEEGFMGGRTTSMHAYLIWSGCTLPFTGQKIYAHTCTHADACARTHIHTHTHTHTHTHEGIARTSRLRAHWEGSRQLHTCAHAHTITRSLTHICHHTSVQTYALTPKHAQK